jgi:hypothetical protein
LAINYDLAASPLPREKFWTISHEMMHAIMFGDRVEDNCSVESFEVLEGIPDGAAMYLTNHKFRGYSGGISYTNSAVGLRSYRLPFFFFTNTGIGEKSWLETVTGYGTSSFWHFLMERFGGMEVLPHFLDSPVKKGPSREDMYRWLEERLQSLETIKSGAIVTSSPDRPTPEPPGMYEVFPAFITEFASYGGARFYNFDHTRYGQARQARGAWLKNALGGCEEIKLSPQKKHDKVTLFIAENAAKCIRVQYDGFSGNVMSGIEMLSSQLGEVDRIHLGWAWKIGPDKEENCFQKRKSLKSKWPPCILKAFSQTGPTQERYARTWPSEMLDFGASGGKSAERIYVLSNVAVDPWKTKPATNLTVKVAVSDSTGNGQPTEPIDQRAVPRVRKPQAMSLGKIGQEQLYGLQTDPPAPDGGLLGVRFGPYTPGRHLGAKAKPGGYSVGIYEAEYGKTGPVRGVIRKEDNGDASSVISSDLCKGGNSRPVGRILKSDEDALEIEVEADLCQARPGQLKQCEDGCPVVDHFKGEITLAFGWRQFSETAPTDIRTRGIERYINTMPDSLTEALKFGANTAFPQVDPFSDTPEVTTLDQPGLATGESLGSCACTCEERENTLRQAEDLKAREAAGEDISGSSFMGLMGCAMSCQTEYMVCEMDKNKREEAAREAERQQETTAKCDCSCAAFDQLQQRSKELQAGFKPGDPAPLDEIARMSQCMNTCQNDYFSCNMK